MLKIFFIGCLILFTSSLWAQTLTSRPVIPANGFNCVKTQMMVTCKGSFPGIPGTFSSSGAYQVTIQYETPENPGFRLSFDSSTGCLMKVGFDRSGKSTAVEVWNASGIAKSFIMPSQQNEASNFCQGK